MFFRERFAPMSELLRLPGGAVLHVHGPAAAPPILFLHGVGGGAWSWAPQVAEFASDRRVYVWEARGHGDAARVDDAGLADYAVDAQEAFDAVRVASPAPVALTGHSMGGLLALALAGRQPSAVGALALIDPVYAEANEAHVPPPLRPLARALAAPLVGSLERGGPVATWISRSIFFRSFADRAEAERWWPVQRAQVPLEYPRMVLEGIGGVEGFTLDGLADRIIAPTLVLNGRFSALATRLHERLGPRFIEDRIPGGHYLQLDRPAAVSERLRRFLAEHAAP
ncbi:alpha/beta hydrolase [Vulcanimicrobium alpinum]|uniref:Alpha/beta hydrolase n=2 Tax=Vulcanimicrobium alpinum TaxID=3016050 RepID=A0AAN2CAU9_UNVUL|nr:alpha/beta hydrolase [Vulcanimicrobium alpinum]